VSKNGGVEEGTLAEEDGRKEKTGENCNTKSFITDTPHQM